MSYARSLSEAVFHSVSTNTTVLPRWGNLPLLNPTMLTLEPKNTTHLNAAQSLGVFSTEKNEDLRYL